MSVHRDHDSSCSPNRPPQLWRAAFHETAPSLHEPASLLEHVAAPVGHLHLVRERVREHLLRHFARVGGGLGAPVAEGATEPRTVSPPQRDAPQQHVYRHVAGRLAGAAQGATNRRCSRSSGLSPPAERDILGRWACPRAAGRPTPARAQAGPPGGRRGCTRPRACPWARAPAQVDHVPVGAVALVHQGGEGRPPVVGDVPAVVAGSGSAGSRSRSRTGAGARARTATRGR